MIGKTSQETIRTPAWIAAAVAVCSGLGFVYFPLLRELATHQWLKAEYSHAFLVPFFSIYLAWHWRASAPKQIRWPEPWGLAILAAGIAIFVYFGIKNVAKEWLQGLSLVVNLCGAALLLAGWSALRWLWPILAFLIFMFPLPYSVEYALGKELQQIAARGAEFTLQTVGYASYREGNIVHVRDHTLEVAQACNGLSMLLTFLAMSVAYALVVRRPWVDRGLILISAIPVAVICNILRIALTGVLYNEVGEDIGKQVFHDFAGWLMMPLALVFIWLELKILDWVLIADLGKASREEVLKMNSTPAHLFMPAFENADRPKRSGGKGSPKAGSEPPRGKGR